MPIEDPTVAALLSLDLTHWVLQTIAMIITALLIPKLTITSPLGALLTVITLAFINSKVWDAALFFQIPNTLSSQAILLFLTNGIIFWLIIKLLPGIEVEGILPALAAPVVFTLCSMGLEVVGPMIDWSEVYDTIVQILGSLREHFQTVKDFATENTSQPSPTTSQP